MMRTIKDLKSKTSSMESDGVYIMPFNPKYEKDELEESKDEINSLKSTINSLKILSHIGKINLIN
mgnify:CR=1 FL=1